MYAVDTMNDVVWHVCRTCFTDEWGIRIEDDDEQMDGNARDSTRTHTSHIPHLSYLRGRCVYCTNPATNRCTVCQDPLCANHVVWGLTPFCRPCFEDDGSTYKYIIGGGNVQVPSHKQRDQAHLHHFLGSIGALVYMYT